MNRSTRESAPEPPRSSPYLDPYRKAIDEHGPSFEATLWANRDFQTKRFEVFLDLQDFSGRTIIDAGAGQGGFAGCLSEREIAFERYIGLEAIVEQVQQHAALGRAREEMRVADFVADASAFRLDGSADGPKPDVIIFSGSLNTLTPKAMRRTLASAWEATGESLLFNFLSSRTTRKISKKDAGPARRFDPLALADWALDRTAHVTLRHDYLPYGHDATIVMRRPPDQSAAN